MWTPLPDGPAVGLPSPELSVDAAHAGTWGEPHARAALTAAGPRLGLDPSGASLVRALSTVVFRAGDLAVKVYPPTVDVARLRGVLAAVPPDTGALVLPLGPDPLVVTDHGVVSAYPWVDRGDEVSWSELGALLCDLHRAAGIDEAALPRWTPLTRVPMHLEVYARHPDFDGSIAAALATARERLLGEVGTLSSDLGPGLIHGDVSPENVHRSRAGHPVFIDIDWVAYGPREYDLVSAALRRERGELSEEQYLEFAGAYGCDVRSWRGLGLVEDVCELGGLTFALWSACLRGESLDWLPAAVARWV